MGRPDGLLHATVVPTGTVIVWGSKPASLYSTRTSALPVAFDGSGMLRDFWYGTHKPTNPATIKTAEINKKLRLSITMVLYKHKT